MTTEIPISVMSFPTRMVVGPGALSRLPQEMEILGKKRALIVADPGVEKARIVKQVEATLASAGFSGGVFLGVSKNPVEADVLAGVQAYKELEADVVIGLGGGAPMDVAKVVALKVTHHRPLADYDDLKGGDRLITPDMPPMIAIPTTAGTGSEVGRAGVIVLGEGADAHKVVVFAPYMMPKVAILDAELTVGLPPAITAATGIDAMTHALEAYVAKGTHPFADMYALAALARVGSYLERAVKDGGDIEARHEMLLAASMGAISFQKGLGACHALAHPLGSVANVHHGLANALMLPHVIRFNLETVPNRYAIAAQALGMSGTGSLEWKALDCLRRVAQLIEAVGITGGLRDHGVTREHIEQMIPQALEDAAGAGNPRGLDEASVRAMYEAAY
ncbi:MAG: iron-containing alcohol dehydrogenase [Deltaproteobacteria bacterium]|nr:iron-containing alcohol dehydrogenase [Deltaproteobacteria bacterium]